MQEASQVNSLTADRGVGCKAAGVAAAISHLLHSRNCKALKADLLYLLQLQPTLRKQRMQTIKQVSNSTPAVAAVAAASPKQAAHQCLAAWTSIWSSLFFCICALPFTWGCSVADRHRTSGMQTCCPMTLSCKRCKEVLASYLLKLLQLPPAPSKQRIRAWLYMTLHLVLTLLLPLCPALRLGLFCGRQPKDQ